MKLRLLKQLGLASVTSFSLVANRIALPINPSQPVEFYRLVYP
jgi:hypothetical protein